MSEDQKDTPSAVLEHHEGRLEGVKYEANQGEIHTREEVEQIPGYYDADGFYILEDGSFYDPNGYYFDSNGYDEFGGYYEDGYYVPGPDYEEEYYRKYNELYGEEVGHHNENEFEYDLEDYFSESESEDDEDALERKQLETEVVKEAHLTEKQKYIQQLKEQVIQQEANRLIPIAQHINPAIKWLQEQPETKRFAVKIEGLPLQANSSHIERLILKKLKESEVKDIPESLSKLIKIVIDKDKFGTSLGVGFCTTAYRPALIELIKLHKKVWARSKLRTFLSGFLYDDLEEYGHDQDEDYHDQKIEKWALKNPDYELMIYRKKKRLQKKGVSDESVPKKGGAGKAPTTKKVFNSEQDSEVGPPQEPKRKAVYTQDYGSEVAEKPKKVEQADDDDYGVEIKGDKK